MGRRVSKKVSAWNSSTLSYQLSTETKFLYDGWNLLADLNALNSNAVVCTYAWGLDLSDSLQGAGGVGGLLFATDHSSQVTCHSACFDGNGNVIGYVDMATGAQSATYEYNAFGEAIMAEGPAITALSFRFSTKYQDVETTLYYYGLRYYSPAAGRWINRDPIEESGGLNLFGFLSNNSNYGVDSLGLRLLVVSNFDPETAAGMSWKWDTEPNRNRQAWSTSAAKVECGVGLLEKIGVLFGSKCCVECEITLKQRIYRNKLANGAVSWTDSYGHEQQHVASMLMETKKIRSMLQNEPACFVASGDAENAAKAYTIRYQQMLDAANAQESAHSNPGSPPPGVGRPPITPPPDSPSWF